MVRESTHLGVSCMQGKPLKPGEADKLSLCASAIQERAYSPAVAAIGVRGLLPFRVDETLVYAGCFENNNGSERS